MQQGRVEEVPARQPSVLRQAGTVLVRANLHIGLIAVAFVLGTYALLGLPPSLPLLVLAFCGAFLVYHLERGLGPAPEDRYNHPERLDWLERHRTLYWTTAAIACCGGIAALPFLSLRTLAAGAVLGAASIGYMAPVLPGGRRLKSVWFLKPLLIAAGWSLGGVLLPAIDAGARITLPILTLTAYRFLFVLPNALLADWPDRDGDARAGLSTVATALPVRWMQRTPVLLLIMALCAGVLFAFLSGSWALLALDLAGPLLMLGLAGRPVALHDRVDALMMDLLVAWPGVTALVFFVFSARSSS